MTLEQWLDHNIVRLAELMSINYGKLNVEGRINQVVATDQNRYGRLGLTFDEAFELQYYRGIVDALTNAASNPENAAKHAMSRIAKEAKGVAIEIATPEQRKILLGK